MQTSKQKFIEFMMEAEVLRFGDFTTKSGRKSPYFVNTGNYKTGAQLNQLGSFYAELIKAHADDAFDAYFGPAYKGIPLAAAAAIAMYRSYGIDKPYFFNRKEAKDHGEGGTTIGYTPKDGDRIILIEDVITAGTAIREVLPILQHCARVSVPHMFISVDRCERGVQENRTAVMQVRADYGIDVHAIIRVTDILDYLKTQQGYETVVSKMEAYIDQYCILES